jgi:outer membrane receptor protein involved in Fe transport
MVSMHTRRSGIYGLGTGLLGLALTPTFAAYAQTQTVDRSTVVIEEVVVTARVREETLQDVPISVSLVSGKTIDEAGIDNLEELATSIPNFTVTQDPIGDKINIRGIFTGEIASLEQSVSTFVDGVNRGRGTQSRFAFLDLERVEVLRGPQGTLFGKNTVGGALNLTTRKPTQTFAANLNAGYETELEETTIAGYISGPVADTLRGRVAFSTSDQREGYIENRFLLDSAPQSENNVVRGILDWDITPSTLLRIRAEYGDFELDGQPFGLRSAGPLAPLLQPFGVASGSLTETASGQTPGSLLDFGSNGIMEGDSREFAATFEQQFANGGSLEVVAAFSALDFQRRLDADFSPLELLGFDDTEDYEQSSLSIRFISPDEGRLRYIAGLYYQDSELSLTGLTSLNTPTVAGLTGASCQAAGLSPADAQQLFLSVAGLAGQTPANAASQLQRAGDAATVRTCTNFGATQLLPTALGRVNTLDQKGDALAAYGQVDVTLTDSLGLTLGLRYTREQKDARQAVFSSNFGTFDPNPALDGPLVALFEATPHDFGRDVLDREENKLNYSLSLQWKVTSDVNAYFSTSTGFKAGGFNFAAFGPTPDEAEFDPEEVRSYELGLKSTLLDGRLRLNAAYFFTSIDDLQVAQFTGGTSFIVQNAAEAEVQGLELDGRLQLSRNFGLSASAAYTDFEFTSFPRAGCNVQQLTALRQSSYDLGTMLRGDGDPTNDAAAFTAQLLGSNQTLRDCSALGINDLKGRTTEQVPEYTAQFGVDYRMELGNFVIDTLADVVWNDEQFRQTDLDPQTKSGSFAKTNLSLGFSRPGGSWKAMLVGRNIFDKKTFSYANDTPLLDNARQQIVDRPRTIKLQLQYDFK